MRQNTCLTCNHQVPSPITSNIHWLHVLNLTRKHNNWFIKQMAGNLASTWIGIHITILFFLAEFKEKNKESDIHGMKSAVLRGMLQKKCCWLSMIWHLFGIYILYENLLNLFSADNLFLFLTKQNGSIKNLLAYFCPKNLIFVLWITFLS